MMSSDSPPKPILSAITFPITLSLDRTVYLSYYSRYSRFCYFDHFFCPYLRIHWTDFAHLKDNIVGNKISYSIGHHHFFCICHISRDFLKKKATPHKIPSSDQVPYYFDHNSGTTEPFFMIFFLNTHNLIPYNNAHFFCICHISRDFLKKPLRHLNLTTF